MQDIFIALLIAFVLFRLFRGSIFVYRVPPRNPGANQQQYNKKPVGEITIEKTGKDKPLKDEGDYVDYEEVK